MHRRVSIFGIAVIAMPAERNKRGKLASSTDPEYEKHMQEAIDGLVSGEFKSIRDAAKKKNVSTIFKCSFQGNSDYF